MASEPIRDPIKDHLLTPKNCAFIVIWSVTQCAPARRPCFYGLPIVHSTVNAQTRINKPPIKAVRSVLEQLPVYDRTSINAWEDLEFRKPSTPPVARSWS